MPRIDPELFKLKRTHIEKDLDELGFKPVISSNETTFYISGNCLVTLDDLNVYIHRINTPLTNEEYITKINCVAPKNNLVGYMWKHSIFQTATIMLRYDSDNFMHKVNIYRKFD